MTSGLACPARSSGGMSIHGQGWNPLKVVVHKLSAVLTATRKRCHTFTIAGKREERLWKSLSFAELRFDGVSRRELPVPMRLVARGP